MTGLSAVAAAPLRPATPWGIRRWASIAIGLLVLYTAAAVINATAALTVALVIVAGCLTAVVVSIRRFRPEHPAAWWMLTAGMALQAAGGAAWGILNVPVYADQRAGWPNALHFLGYACLAAGALLLLGRRRFQEDPAEALDTLILTAAVGVAGWGLVLRPLGLTINLDPGTTALITLYPLVAIATVGCAAQLWFSSDGKSNTSMRLVVAALGWLIVGTVYQSAQALADGQTWGNSWSVLLRLPFFLLLAMAALHPSMATTSVISVPNQPTPWWRLALLTTLAAIAPLGVLVSDTLLERPPAYFGLLLGTLVLFAAVVLRLAFLGRSLSRSTAQVRTLNRAGIELVGALDLEHIRQIAQEAAIDCAEEPTARVWIIDDHRDQLPTTSENSGDTDSRLDEPAEVAVVVVHPRGSERAQELGAGSDVLLYEVALPTTVGMRRRMVVSTREALTHGSRETLNQLAESVAHALDRVQHSVMAAESASQERLQRLLHDASDVIAVLDSAARITFVTPAVSKLIGPQADDMVGMNWLDLIHPDDRFLVERVLHRDNSAPTVRSEIRLLTDSGEIRFVEMTVTPYRDEAGNGFTVSCHDITRRYELEQQLKHQAFHDTLTGLANRALMQERLRQALDNSRRTGQDFAVMFLDLDDFKTVNDSLGHAVGDALLRTVARRLRTTLRTKDTPARLGGDEFAVVLEDVTDHQEVERIAARVVEGLAQPVRVGGSELLVAASVGVAYGNGAIDDIEDVMRNADLALYGAKGSGKNRYAIYEPQMHESALTKMELTADMRRGIARSEFVVHYQPIVSLTNRSIVGVEALVRWNHPTRGLLAPGQFIALAEDTGLVIPMGREVMEAALIDVGHWNETLGLDLVVTVNVSARQLLDTTVVDDVRFALSISGVKPGNVVLEVTESVLLPGQGIMAERLRELADLGVRIYIDDFGTGYSSLSYLSQLPVHGIKLAREFVSVLPGTSAESGLVRTIRDLARTLELDDVVAEGIETKEQLELLMAMGFLLGQGYLLARPADALTTRDLLATGLPGDLGIADAGVVSGSISGDSVSGDTISGDTLAR